MAVPFYIAEGLASSFGSIASKSYWGKKKKKTDPFKQSGIVNQTKRKKSQGSKLPPRKSYGKKLPIGMPGKMSSDRKRSGYSSKRQMKKRKSSYVSRRPLKKRKTLYKGKRKKTGRRQFTKLRISNFGVTTQQNKIWVGASTVGPQINIYKVISLAILNKYLPKVGDIRSNLAQTTGGGAADCFSSVKIVFDRESTIPADAGGDEYESSAIINSDLNTMVDSLAVQLNNAAIRGYYPTEIFIAKKDFTSATAEADRIIFRDTMFGKTKLYVKVNGRFRFNNITPAADGAATAGQLTTDVQANPLSGKLMAFRNQRPLFDQSYQEGLSDATTLAGINNLHNLEDTNEAIGGDNASVSAFAHLNAPPLNMRSVFKNFKSSSNYFLKPGSFKTHYTTFEKEVTLFTFMRDFSRARYNHALASNNATSKMPPYGDSFMVCLRPTIKTALNEIVKVAYDYEWKFLCALSSAKRPGLPSFSTIE